MMPRMHAGATVTHDEVHENGRTNGQTQQGARVKNGAADEKKNGVYDGKTILRKQWSRGTF